MRFEKFAQAYSAPELPAPTSLIPEQQGGLLHDLTHRKQSPWWLPLELGLSGAIAGGTMGALSKNEDLTIPRTAGMGAILGALLGTGGAYYMSKHPDFPSTPPPPDWKAMERQLSTTPGMNQRMSAWGQKVTDAYDPNPPKNWMASETEMLKPGAMHNFATVFVKQGQAILNPLKLGFQYAPKVWGAVRSAWPAMRAAMPTAKTMWNASKPARTAINVAGNIAATGYGVKNLAGNTGELISNIEYGATNNIPTMAAHLALTAPFDLMPALQYGRKFQAAEQLGQQAFKATNPGTWATITHIMKDPVGAWNRFGNTAEQAAIINKPLNVGNKAISALRAPVKALANNPLTDFYAKHPNWSNYGVGAAAAVSDSFYMPHHQNSLDRDAGIADTGIRAHTQDEADMLNAGTNPKFPKALREMSQSSLDHSVPQFQRPTSPIPGQ